MRLYRTEREIEAYLQNKFGSTEDDLKQRQQIQEKVDRKIDTHLKRIANKDLN